MVIIFFLSCDDSDKLSHNQRISAQLLRAVPQLTRQLSLSSSLLNPHIRLPSVRTVSLSRSHS